MLICSKDQVPVARDLHPAAFILCPEERLIYTPGENHNIMAGAERIAKILASPDSVVFEPPEEEASPETDPTPPSSEDPDPIAEKEADRSFDKAMSDDALSSIDDDDDEG